MAALSLQETMERLLLNVRSGHPLIYIVTHEEDRVLDYLIRLLRIVRLYNPRKQLLRWDAGGAYQRLEEQAADALKPEENWRAAAKLQWRSIRGGALEREGQVHWQNLNNNDALATLDGARTLGWNAQVDMGEGILVMLDIHNMLTRQYGPLVRPLRNTAAAMRKYYEQQRDIHCTASPAGRFYQPDEDVSPPPFPYKTIIVLAPSKRELSAELERDMIVCEFPLPEEDELRDSLDALLQAKLLSVDPKPTPTEYSQVVDTNENDAAVEPAKYAERLRDLLASGGRGLTLDAFKHGINGYAVRGERLSSRHVNDMLNLKASFINNDALQYTPNVSVPLGGLHRVREWVASRRDPAVYEAVREDYRLPPLNGVMLCGGSGTGKSMLAKLIAQEFHLALLRLDVGALFGSYIGESEEKTRDALQLAEVLSPIVLWIDECDKAFSGMGDGGDNGVSARVFGTFLTWLAEKKDSVFVVTTANDFRALFTKYPEFSRKGRFDEIFWIDLPDQSARREIFHIYLAKALEKNPRIEFRDVEVREVVNLSEIAVLPEGNTPLEKLAHVLSHDTLSNEMTGAEIEYYVKEILYDFYNRDRVRGTRSNAQIIVNKLKEAKGRALYNVEHGGDLVVDFGAMRDIAENNHWPKVS